MYDHIIVPLDGSDTAARALAPAAALAREYDGQVSIVSVVGPGFAESMTNTAKEQARAAGIEAADINVVVSHRSPVPKLLDALDEDPAALLCMSTTGRSHIGQAIGSVAEQLLRVRTGPFVLVGPHCTPDSFKPRGKLLVAVDGSETSHEILPLAAAWTIAYEMEPEVVTVVSSADAAQVANAGTETGTPRHAAQQLEYETERQVTWEVLHHEHPADAIVRRAEATEASIIAITTHGRTGLGRLMAGSVAIEVVHKATCPVLVHRPLRLRT